MGLLKNQCLNKLQVGMVKETSVDPVAPLTAMALAPLTAMVLLLIQMETDFPMKKKLPLDQIHTIHLLFLESKLSFPVTIA